MECKPQQMAITGNRITRRSAPNQIILACLLLFCFLFLTQLVRGEKRRSLEIIVWKRCNFPFRVSDQEKFRGSPRFSGNPPAPHTHTLFNISRIHQKMELKWFGKVNTAQRTSAIFWPKERKIKKILAKYSSVMGNSWGKKSFFPPVWPSCFWPGCAGFETQNNLVSMPTWPPLNVVVYKPSCNIHSLATELTTWSLGEMAAKGLGMAMASLWIVTWKSRVQLLIRSIRSIRSSRGPSVINLLKGDQLG